MQSFSGVEGLVLHCLVKIVHSRFFTFCACRYKLPVIVIIMNNAGIYNGFEEDTWQTFYQSGEDLGLV